ncbi:MAG: hypothetical protein JXR26_00400, partial [Balneolaceae bacterium]|nr:hypothetical protein [Balneolaceae bacterium]
MLISIGLLLLIVVARCGEVDSNGSSATAITDSALTATYPDLYQAIFSRNAAHVLSFTDHQNEQISRQAWRGLAQTPVDSLSSIIEQVKQDRSQEAWFALSMHDLSKEQLRHLEDYWLDHPGQRAGISLVLGRQGDEQTVEFLTNQITKATGSDYEQSVALALSRLMNQFESTEAQQAEVLNHAFVSSDPQRIRAWLYGFYRGDEQRLLPAIQDLLYNKWKSYGIASSTEVDQ